MTLRPVCIAQLIQVELFRRRLRLAQIQGCEDPLKVQWPRMRKKVQWTFAARSG